jgi:hypothetical protein
VPRTAISGAISVLAGSKGFRREALALVSPEPYGPWVPRSRRKSAPTLKTDLIRALLAKHPEASTAEIQERMMNKHRIAVSRQSVQYARRVPKPKATGRPRKNITCPNCGHEFHARLDA